MKRGFKLRQCTIGRPATTFLQDQLQVLDYDFNAALSAASPVEQDAFYRFAAAFGCFSRDHMVDDEGQPTATIMGQSASALLRRLLQDDGTRAQGLVNARLRVGDFAPLFGALPKNATPNQDFLHYLRYSYRDQNGITHYPNLELLLNLERGDHAVVNEIEHQPRPGIFAKVMTNFQLAQNFRITLNKVNTPKRLPYVEAFKLLYDQDLSAHYQRVNGRNRALANLLKSYNLPQRLFDTAAAVFQEAARNRTPHHILKKPLTEPQGTHNFTYEMLDKYDPANAIIGMMTSCCAVLESAYYGGSITEVAITEHDVQNMVVRNRRGNIVAKGTLYINPRIGEAVFNNFEINEDYMGSSPKCRTQQNAILDAFRRGTAAVVQRYNQLSPEHPMRRVTVGMNDNRPQWMDLPAVRQAQRVMTNYYFQNSNTGIQYLLYENPQVQSLAQPDCGLQQ